MNASATPRRRSLFRGEVVIMSCRLASVSQSASIMNLEELVLTLRYCKGVVDLR